MAEAGQGRREAGTRPGDDAPEGALRRVLLAWAALIALLLASLGSAFVPLGAGNAPLGLGIAVAKTAIVGWLFMRLRRAGALIRVVAACGLATLALLAALSGVDYATRVDEPAPMQTPLQLPPLRPDGSGR